MWAEKKTFFTFEMHDTYPYIFSIVVDSDIKVRSILMTINQFTTAYLKPSSLLAPL